ncbi:MAG TPA: sigma-70 family RNA polymerase sigma factor, partial [Actinomycetales bacterium]|nr:sigma-70 family RNA polymerase sigma factor [Actinomycetales bacterium]
TLPRVAADVGTAAGPDAESVAWVTALREVGAVHDEAVARLHAMLLRVARHEVSRRRGMVPWIGWSELDVVAQQSADDAVVALLRRLDSYEGRSRFTTWAYKFAVLTTSVAVRKVAWRSREIPAAPEVWDVVIDPAASPEQVSQGAELAGAVRTAIATTLTPHQRDVILAVVVQEVPIDVLADRLGTTRGALYKTLHDARAALRKSLVLAGMLEGGPHDKA